MQKLKRNNKSLMENSMLEDYRSLFTKFCSELCFLKAMQEGTFLSQM